MAETAAGAVAFSRTGDPATGEFEDAVVLLTLGEVPPPLAQVRSPIMTVGGPPGCDRRQRAQGKPTAVPFGEHSGAPGHKMLVDHAHRRLDLRDLAIVYQQRQMEERFRYGPWVTAVVKDVGFLTCRRAIAEST